MSSLTSPEYARLADALRTLYAHTDVHTLPRQTIAVLERAVPANMIAFNLIDHRNHTLQGEHNAPNPGEVDALFPVFEATMHTHPLCEWTRRPPSAAAIKVTDVVTQREWRERAIYRELYQPTRLPNIIIFHLPNLPHLQTGFTLHRDGKDFTGRERAVLNFLSPHFSQVWLNAQRFTRAQAELTRLRQALEAGNHELLLLDSNHLVQWTTPRAAAWLHAYSGQSLDAAGHLPGAVASWLRQRLKSLTRPDAPPANDGVLQLLGAEGTLTVQAAPGVNGQIQLLLREHSFARGRDLLRRQGLTRRECEVLHWIVEGKTNPAIAGILGISARTVGTHIEHILRKLSVETRQAAATRYHELTGC